MHVTKDEIERVRRRHDLVTAIQDRGVALTRKGSNYVGLCPFHDDRDPSFVVNPDKQLWNCFGACRTNGGKSGGDVFAFVARKEGVTFLEALKRLGYEEPKKTAARRTRSKAKPISKPSALPDTALLGRVAAHYHRIFRERTEGQDYLNGRGLDDAAMLSAFEVGYVDGTLRATFDAEGDTGQALRAAGLVNARGREHFLGCVVVPLTLPDIGVVGFYGRHVERDRHLYLPGPRRGLFHWQALKGSEDVILTESVIDALTLWRAGFRNVSCVYGTQGFTEDHSELLQRFRVKRVLLWLDNDEAGTQATEAIAERIGKLGIDVIDARVEGAKDPNALSLSIGTEAFQKRVAASLPLTVKTTANPHYS